MGAQAARAASIPYPLQGCAKSLRSHYLLLRKGRDTTRYGITALPPFSRASFFPEKDLLF